MKTIPLLNRQRFGFLGSRTPRRGPMPARIMRRQIVFTVEQMKLVAINRPSGYLDECLRLGTLSADESMLAFSPAAFIDLRNRFPETIKTRVVNPGVENIGLGDRLHKAFGPIGRAIGWPCMKGDGSTDLKPGSPCDKTKNFLNKFTL